MYYCALLQHHRMWKGIPLVQLRHYRSDLGVSGNVWIREEVRKNAQLCTVSLHGPICMELDFHSSYIIYACENDISLPFIMYWIF